jgi:hypothetical protein
MSTTITITNPCTNALVEQDISGITQAELDAYSGLMDAELREQLHAALAPCTPAEYLAAWVAAVGADEAGRVILGS